MRSVLLAVLLALIAAVPAAQARHFTYGSSLTQRATRADRHPRDWAAFPLKRARTYRAPAQGEVTQVSFKGTVLKPRDDAAYDGRYPGFVFHVVVLHPTAHGRMQLMVSTENLPFPFGGNRQQITTFHLQRYVARMCVQKGDVVALATSGGFGNEFPQFGGFPDDFYSHGYPVRMFARSASGVGLFKQPAGSDTFQVGDRVNVARHSGSALLMRTTIGTGRDARWTCRTKAQRKHDWANPGV